MRDNLVWRERLSDGLGLLTIVALILWFCQDILLTGQVPFFRDLSTYFYPLRFGLYESFRNGELPLWNRHSSMGFPQFADFQTGGLYSPHLFLSMLSFFPAIRVIFIFHFLIAGIGAYCLIRSWNYPPYLSIVGALLFSLGGTLVSLSNLLNHFQTAVWLPWALLSWEKLLLATSLKNFLIFTLVSATQFLAGSPELFTISMALIFLDGIRVRGFFPNVSFGKVFSLFLCANFLVLALTTVQLLPTAELFLQSRRQQPIPPQEALHWSLKPSSLLNLFFLDKEIDPSAAEGMRLFFGSATPFFVSYYLGAISVFGIALWLCFSSICEKITLLVLIAASLIIALGIYTPIYPFLFHHMHFLGAFRFPEKVFFFTYALLIYIAVTGLGDLLLHDERSVKKAFVMLVAVCVMWVGLSVFLRFNLDLLGRFIAAQAGSPLTSSDHAKKAAGALLNLDRQVVLSIGLVLLLVMAKAKAIRRPLFRVLIISVTFVDLAWAHRELLFPLTPDFVYSSPRIVQQPNADLNRVFYYPGRNLHPSFVSALGRPSFREATALSFQNLLPNAGILYGFDYMQEIDALARQPYSDFLAFANHKDFETRLRLLRTFNVRYLLSFRPLPENGITLIGQYPQYFSWLYSISDAVPRAYIVNKTIMAQNSDQVLQLLASPGFNPMHEVVLDRTAGITPQRPLVATTKILRYENQSVTVYASLNDSGILVLTDSYYPGWKAYVDGKEARILKANHFFRAVPLSAGNHIVEFRYEPHSFMIGLIISLTTLLLLVITSMFCYLRRSNYYDPGFLNSKTPTSGTPASFIER